MLPAKELPGLLLALCSALTFCQSGHAVVIPPFSSGMLTPETISQVPAGFGAHEGSYFIPDAAKGSADPALHTVWIVPEGGGDPTVFSTGNVDDLLAGMFLPSNWGANAGKFLTVGRGRDPDTGLSTQTGTVYTYTSDGVPALFAEYPNAPFNQALIAPAGFGTLGGKLVLSEVENFGRIDVVSPDPSIPIVEGFADSTLITQAFGLAFAPSGFGAAGGRLLASDPFTGTIIAIDAEGRVAPDPFASIPLLAGQTGLRQMEFAPTDFLIHLGIPGDLLMVSVSGSLIGGGSLGDVVALDATGTIVASLRVAEALDRFDPRGMFFRPDGSLLISDASDPLILAFANDFQPGRFANAVPEPSVLLLLVVGLASLRTARASKSS